MPALQDRPAGSPIGIRPTGNPSPRDGCSRRKRPLRGRTLGRLLLERPTSPLARRLRTRHRKPRWFGRPRHLRKTRAPLGQVSRRRAAAQTGFPLVPHFRRQAGTAAVHQRRTRKHRAALLPVLPKRRVARTQRLTVSGASASTRSRLSSRRGAALLHRSRVPPMRCDVTSSRVHSPPRQRES